MQPELPFDAALRLTFDAVAKGLVHDLHVL